jgi:molybdopterin adenylyltransferase
MRVGVLTVSDGCARGERVDESGPLIVEWAEERGHEVSERNTVPDETSSIVPCLVAWADGGSTDVILTTGGTGLSSRDVTPEATRSVLERPAPGIAEAIRRTGAGHTPYAILSRGLAGVRGRTLIVNLPGSVGGVRDGLSVLDEVLEHAVEVLSDDASRHQGEGAG